MAQRVMEIKYEPLLNGNDFKISVSKNHTFGTDAVLLYNFANAKKNDTAVDLGTGCGIIALLMLRDNKCQKVYGVDISEEAIDLCLDTKERLNLEKFKPILANLTELKGKIPFGSASLVVCNPPYKAKGAGIKSANPRELVARHETECELRDIVKTAAKLLNTGGRFCVCQRPERTAELLCLMSEEKLQPKRIRFVAKRPENEPWLVLIEGKKGANRGNRVAPTLFVEKADGSFSDEMLEIYGKYKP